jgi:hypothetical protein
MPTIYQVLRSRERTSDAAGYREVRLWDLESEAIIWQNDIGQDIGQVRWQDGRMVVVSTAQGPKSQAPRVDVFDFREGRLGL